MIAKAAARARAAFTLIEMLISAALMSIILASAYACLSAGVSTQKLIDARSDASQSARVALALMAADLRSAVPLSKENEFVGIRRHLEESDADNVDFGTRNYTPKREHESDFCEVSYFVQRDPVTRTMTLFRRRDPTPDPEPFSGGTREEITRGLAGLRFEYYDGFDWYDEWGDPEGKKQFSSFPDPNVSGLPEAVRITLKVDPSFARRRQNDERQSGEPPLTFQTTARVNMSLFFYQTGGGSSSSNNAAPSPTGGDFPPGGPP